MLRRETRFRLLIGILYVVAGATLANALLQGWSYYMSPMEVRPHLDAYRRLRPAGSWGHAYGMVGAALLLLLLLYSARKRVRRLQALGTPAEWLQVHICFGIVGPLLIVLHTSFRISGLVAVSFWSMVAVASSGIFGRWLYLQIPRNIAGHELSRQEIAALEAELEQRAAGEVRPKELARLSRQRVALERNVRRLEKVRAVFHWWHVIHKPFAIIMLLVMIVHIAVAISLGYTWVF